MKLKNRFTTVLLPIFICALSSVSNLHGQNFKEYTRSLKKNSPYYFGYYDTSKYLFRFDLIGLIPERNNNIINGINFHVESQIHNNWSISTGLYIRQSSSTGLYVQNGNPRFGFVGEIRKYKKNQPYRTNLNGFYKSAMIDLNLDYLKTDQSKIHIGSALTLRGGFQARISKVVYFDISIGAGAAYRPANESITLNETTNQYTLNYEQKWIPILDPRIGIGIGIGSSNVEMKDPSIFYNIPIENKSWWKLNLFGLMNTQMMPTSLHLEYEFKLNSNSSFSINNGIKLGISNDQRHTGAELDGLFVENDFQFHTAVNIEPRYYYNLKKRIEKGLTGANFSANFFSIALGYEDNRYLSRFEHAPYHHKNNSSLLHTDIYWGIQRQLLGLAFWQFKGGIRGISYDLSENVEKPLFIGIDMLFDFKIGLTF